MTRKLLDGSLTAGRSRIKDGSTTGLRVDEVPEKGRGVFADRKFARGDFIDEYDGELISSDEAKKKRKRVLAESVGRDQLHVFLPIQKSETLHRPDIGIWKRRTSHQSLV